MPTTELHPRVVLRVISGPTIRCVQGPQKVGRARAARVILERMQRLARVTPWQAGRGQCSSSASRQPTPMARERRYTPDHTCDHRIRDIDDDESHTALRFARSIRRLYGEQRGAAGCRDGAIPADRRRRPGYGDEPDYRYRFIRDEDRNRKRGERTVREALRRRIPSLLFFAGVPRVEFVTQTWLVTAISIRKHDAKRPRLWEDPSGSLPSVMDAA